MSELHPLETVLSVAWPPAAWQDVTVLVAVSGGADSVAMLRALAALKTAGAGRMIVAHFNHRLREEAADDGRFVGQMASQLGLACEFGEADTAATARQTGDGLEAAARAERYAFLKSAAERVGARYVATAHIADDQAETILHRILRGTALAGLAGMSRARPLGSAATLIRPLLGVRRREIVEYLRQIGQPYREDASNASPAHTRNRIRLGLLPQLAADYNPDIATALLRLGETARDAQRVIDSLTDELLARAVVFNSPQQATVDCRELAGADRHLVRELFVAIWRRQDWPRQPMGFLQWERLAEIALSATAAGAAQQTLPGPVLAQRDGSRLVLTRPS